MQALAQDPADYLRRMGERGDGPLDVAMAALMLAALDQPQRPLARYAAHLDEIAAAAKRQLKLVYRAEEAGQVLAQLMNGQFGYDGDRLTYGSLQSADLISTIERRRGLPVTLGILYIHAARAGGLDAEGLNAPGHFLMRLMLKGQAVILDPFNGGSMVARERLTGPPGLAAAAPGEPQPGEAVSDIDVLLRLENNLRLAALKAGDRARAMAAAQRMAYLAPKRAELWLDLAHLADALGSLGAAKSAYETALRLMEPGAAQHNETVLALAGLKRRLN